MHLYDGNSVLVDTLACLWILSVQSFEAVCLLMLDCHAPESCAFGIIHSILQVFTILICKQCGFELSQHSAEVEGENNSCSLLSENCEYSLITDTSASYAYVISTLLLWFASLFN
jgi:hypothetical protein